MLHADLSFDSAANRYNVAGYTVYRLDPPADGGGGKGKGKNK